MKPRLYEYTTEEWAAMNGHQQLEAMRFALREMSKADFQAWCSNKKFGHAHTNVIAGNYGVTVHPQSIEEIKRKLEYMGTTPLDDLDEYNVLTEHGKQLKRRQIIKQRAKQFVEGVLFDFRMKQSSRLKLSMKE